MLDQVYDRLDQYRSARVEEDTRSSLALRSARCASVLVALTDEVSPRILLTQRSANLSSHAGQVAFPGGKQDPEDRNTLSTALREAHEEVGLEPSLVRALAPLKTVISINRLTVTPWVGVIPAGLEYTANEGELDEVFSVPLRFFLETDAEEGWRRYPEYKRHGLPVWEFDGFVIWGLTAYIIADLLNICFDAGFEIAQRTSKR